MGFTLLARLSSAWMSWRCIPVRASTVNRLNRNNCGIDGDKRIVGPEKAAAI